jgi:uncharacterized protein (DUF1697 family)
MERRIALLRGINLGPNRRIPMPALREAFTGAGFEDVRTYLQSGNIVVSSDSEPDQLERECEQLISAHFGFDVDVVVRTRDQLAEIVERNPLAEVAVNPKRYQVSFLSQELDRERLDELMACAAESEHLAALGRELYAWHPDGVARSRLWAKLAGPGLGVKATARNWTTVTTLLAIADES